ncbi:uncharacterized protein LOC126778403 [Nymphalis io]|uniref:uncharacterized protein LOC126778403 n=1 Tax=Inachis io TaxID=171585 RepID=UPI002167554A|nr:uncharacterized protein LOC126778403 [Nymphalis io]
MDQKYVNIKELKTYRKTDKKEKAAINNNEIKINHHTRVPLSTQNAVKYLLEGTLRLRVCRYCLSVTSKLSELDEMLVIAVNGSLHEVTVRDMVASIHPFKVTEDRNFPNKICSECLTHAIGSYLFSQQCERAERALRNCLDDMYEKFEKLDPLEPVKRRGKRKMNLNHNILYTEHEDVINYAEPIINLINVDIISQNNKTISELECQKCSQVLPNTESLLNHEKSHPKSMWYNCRLCGKSFVKQYHLRRHLKENHILGEEIEKEFNTEHYKCRECGASNKTFVEHLQHIEKHKFKETFQNLIERKVDNLCSVCLDKGTRMVDLGDVIHLHGGYPEITGDRTIRSILRTSIPENTSYKYKELIVPQKANILRLIKRNIEQKSLVTKEVQDQLTFKFSYPELINKDIIEINSIIFLFTKPNAIDPVTGNTIHDRIIQPLIKEVSEMNQISYVDYKEEKINKNEGKMMNCKICWIFKKSTCNTCLASETRDKNNTNLTIKTKENNECNLCWLFCKTGKCYICKKCIQITKKLSNDIVVSKLPDPEIKRRKNIRTEDIDKQASSWQCDICLTNNKNRHTCMCYNKYIEANNIIGFHDEDMKITQKLDILCTENEIDPNDNAMDIEITITDINKENNNTNAAIEAMDVAFEDETRVEVINPSSQERNDFVNSNISQIECAGVTFNIGRGFKNKRAVTKMSEKKRRTSIAYRR